MYKTLVGLLMTMALQLIILVAGVCASSAEPAYFREMNWGHPASNFPNLVYIGCDLENSFYRSQGERLSLNVGNEIVAAEDIVYTFYRGQFSEVTISLGYTQGETVVNRLTTINGPGKKYDLVMGWRWVWLGDNTINDVFLGEHKALWKIRSRKLIERQLASEGFTLEQIYPQ